MGAVSFDEVDIGRDDERHHLLASPEGAGLDDGRLGDVAVPVWEPHQEVHQLFLENENKLSGLFLIPKSELSQRKLNGLSDSGYGH